MSHQAQEEAMTQTASDLKERSQHSLSVFCARHPKLAERIRRSIFVEMNGRPTMADPGMTSLDTGWLLSIT